MGWALLVNGKLLQAAEAEGFAVMVTGDKGIVKQHNNALRKISLIVLGNTDRRVSLAFSGALIKALARVHSGSFEEVPMPGNRDFRRKSGLS